MFTRWIPKWNISILCTNFTFTIKGGLTCKSGTPYTLDTAILHAGWVWRQSQGMLHDNADHSWYRTADLSAHRLSHKLHTKHLHLLDLKHIKEQNIITNLYFNFQVKAAEQPINQCLLTQLLSLVYVFWTKQDQLLHGLEGSTGCWAGEVVEP